MEAALLGLLFALIAVAFGLALGYAVFLFVRYWN